MKEWVEKRRRIREEKVMSRVDKMEMDWKFKLSQSNLTLGGVRIHEKK